MRRTSSQSRVAAKAPTRRRRPSGRASSARASVCNDRSNRSDRSKRSLGVALAAALVVAFGGAASAARKPHWTWRSLHRPLHIPRLATGARCPVTPPTSVDLGTEGVRSLRGRGPAYPTLTGSEQSLEFVYPPSAQSVFSGSSWSGNKVLWWASGRYHGPVLVRGRQLDGPNLLRFDDGLVPPAESRIRPGPGFRPWKGARDHPSYTRVRAPGCYGYQIDGIGFSRVIVFRAVRIPPPPQP
jgi:hypothetical protein